jgi:hypothetical protein
MPESLTMETLDSPAVKHFSVFLDNKVGALLEVVKLINEANVVVLALTIQDSSESSIVRLVVSDPETVELLFEEHDIPHSVCVVVVAELQDGALDLAKVLAALLKAEVNVLFSYPMLIRPRGKALLAMHVDDVECADAVLRGDGFRVLKQHDLSR